MVKVLLAILLIGLPASVRAQSLAPSRGSSATNAGPIGAAIGGVLGVAFGIAPVPGCDGSHCGNSNVFVDSVFFGVTGAAIGGLIGAAIHRAHPSPHTGIDVSPIVSSTARGGRVVLRF